MTNLPYREMPTNVLLIAAVTYDCNQLYNGASPSHTCMGTTRMGRYHDRSSPWQAYIVKSVLEEHNLVYCEMMNRDQEALKRIGHFLPSKVKDGYAKHCGPKIWISIGG